MRYAIALFVLFGCFAICCAGTNAWIAGTSDWSTPGNWLPAQKPTGVDTAMVHNAGTATISTSGETCYQLNVAGVASHPTGTVVMTTGGGLTVQQNVYVGHAAAATGSFNQVDGSMAIVGSLYVASSGSSTGRYTLAGGQLTVVGIGMGSTSANASGIFNQTGGSCTCSTFAINSLQPAGVCALQLSGGTLTTTGNEFWVASSSNSLGSVLQTGGTNTILNGAFSQLVLGYYATSTGTYTLVDGLLYCTPNSAAIGNLGTGTFNQSGGVFRVDYPGLVLGSGVGSVGTYNLMGGTLFFTNTTRVFNVGFSGQGTLNMGSATGTGLITQQVASARNLSIATTNATSRGTLHGWGTVAMTGYLINNGRVIADGYGTAHTLDLSTFASVSNQLANASSNGWFALNKGQLVLPAVLIKSNANALGYSWAESPSNTVPTLVNGARLVFSNALAGTLTGALLSTDRADVPAGLKNVISVWQFSGGTFGTVAMTMRYDDAELARQGLSDSNVHVWQRQGSRWVDITQSVNVGTRTVTTTPVASLGLFAIAADRVTANTVLLVR